MWDPSHTLVRMEAQERALARGEIAALVKEHGRGTPALRSALTKRKLVSVQKSLDGSVHCPDCGCLMDTLVGAPGIKDRVEAVRDIVEDMSAAMARTRRERLVVK